MILASVSPWAIGLTGIAALAYVLPALWRAMPAAAVRQALLAAWCVHALTIVWALAGDPPRFGFAPALSVTGWLVAGVYLVESRMFPQLRARAVLAALGAAALLLALVFPGAPIRSGVSPWLALHWALGIASYGLFAAAVVHAWLLTRAEIQMRRAADTGTGVPLLTLERLTFRFVQAGFVLLSATLLAGLWFGEAGGGWRWDHKTVFSVLSWLAFALLLVGRSRFGWRGRTAVRVLYAGSLLLLLAYVGSRFVLEVILRRAA